MSLTDGARAFGDDDAPPSLARLSQRESEVLEILAHGRTNREVAAELRVSVHAVKFHLASIYRKLGVNNRTEAVVALLRGGRA